jgi:WhiB family redox-sensing transcriptional regulator
VLDTVHMDREGSIKLLSGILAGTPRLPGAACIGRHELYDPIAGNGPQFQRAEQIRLAEAAQVCAGCPVIQRCPSVTTVAVTTIEVIPA